MRREEDVIGEDFQGWPIYKMNIREILENICEHKNGKYIINDNNPILDIYPRTLEDDGMGYGINEKSIIEFSVDEKENYCNVFVEAKHEDNDSKEINNDLDLQTKLEECKETVRALVNKLYRPINQERLNDLANKEARRWCDSVPDTNYDFWRECYECYQAGYRQRVNDEQL